MRCTQYGLCGQAAFKNARTRGFFYIKKVGGANIVFSVGFIKNIQKFVGVARGIVGHGP